ncbi:MAG TPA: DinB family protein [Acidimicrobiales bacterium]|nr:DinB family protein [Acidimicrobiales bacterium]
MEACAECGCAYGTLGRAEIAPELRALAGRYRQVLQSTGSERLRAHPRAGVWSALEYGCHVRDVLAVQRERVLLALVGDEPSFAPMRRDERVLEERYNAQDPTVVAGELQARADALADAFEALDDEGWSRTGLYHWPTTAVRTVEWIGLHTVHECVHHLTDIGSPASDEATDR